MKKNLFILGIAALAFAACSNDEVVEVNQGEAINFRTLVTGVTRATDIDASSLSNFYVTANKSGSSPIVNYFGGTAPATYTKSGDTYTCTTKYYWPSSGDLDFYAFAPATGTDITRTDSTHFSVTPNATPASQRDFIYAVVRDQNKTANGNGVVLNFRHALSKIIIQLKNTSTDKRFTVNNVTLGYIKPTGAFAPVFKTTAGSQIGFCTNGTLISNTTIASETGYYITGAAWTASGTETEYTQVAGTTSYPENTTSPVALTNSMILVPQTLTAASQYSAASAGSDFNGAFISVELRIQDLSDNYIIADGSSYVTAMWPLASITWLPGHKYTYTLDLAGGGYTLKNADSNVDLDPVLDGSEIKFVSVTVDNWIDAGDNAVSGPTL